MTVVGPLLHLGENRLERHMSDAGRRFVTIAHPDIDGTGQCSLSALDHYRQKGWYPVDAEYQTPAEMVEQRVADLAEQARLGVLLDPDTP